LSRRPPTPWNESPPPDLLPAGSVVAEYGSPHGGSGLGLLADRGLIPADRGEKPDVVIDCFGLMHAADQRGALAERTARLTPGGVLLLQYHSLNTIIRCGQWNALRHGHYAYYSTTALTAMLAAVGFSPGTAWQFDHYGGTILLAARGNLYGASKPDGVIRSLLADDARVGVSDPGTFYGLQREVRTHATSLHDWLVAQRSARATVSGYGAASRAVALLCQAKVDRRLLPAVIDTSPAKQGHRMPGTDIPVAAPAELAAHRPDAVLLFVPDLLAEVRGAFPEVESAGGRWVDAESLGS
jgi:hypothetical protein